MGYQSQMGYRLVRDDGTAGAYIAALFASMACWRGRKPRAWKPAVPGERYLESSVNGLLTPAPELTP
jgi:hypothetical protein